MMTKHEKELMAALVKLFDGSTQGHAALKRRERKQPLNNWQTNAVNVRDNALLLVNR